MPSSRIKLATLVALPLLVVGGALAFAHQGGGLEHHGAAQAHHAEMHLDHMQTLLTRIGASDAQKSQIDGILRGAFGNLESVKHDHHAAFGLFHELLFAPAIDRAKVESLRAEQIKALDDASKGIVTAFEDAAEVLSPGQRDALAREIRAHHGG